MLHREAVSSAESTAEGKVDEFTWERWAEIAVGLTGCPHYGHQVKQVFDYRFNLGGTAEQAFVP